MLEQFQQINWAEIIVGIFIAVAIGATLYFIEYRTGYFIGNKKPYIAQQVFKYRLAGVDDKYKQDVEVLYKGKSVTNWGNIVLEFGNAGRKSIRSDDFEKDKPIRFVFPEDTVILSEPEVTTHPENLQCEVKKVSEHIIEVSPLLLNHEDYFVLNILVENPHDAELDVRIVGVSEVHDKNKLNQRKHWITKFMGWVFLITVLWMLVISIVYQSILGKEIMPFDLTPLIYFSLLLGIITFFANLFFDKQD